MTLKNTIFILCLFTHNIFSHALGNIPEFDEIFKLVTPHNINGYTKLRLGKNNDGGYVIPKELINIIERNYTYGVSDDISFEVALTKENNSIISRTYDHTVNYPSQISDNIFFKKEGISFEKKGSLNTFEDHSLENGDSDKNILLKLDIEGAEWEIFNKIDPKLFNNIPILIIEFHWFNKIDSINLYKNVLEKLSKYFTPFHVHGNNWSSLLSVNNKYFPNVLEVTYINNKHINTKEVIKEEIIDNDITINCLHCNTGFTLNFWRKINPNKIDKISDNFTEVLNYVKRYLPENPIVLEAGAWDGSSTVQMVKTWPNAIIHSFEPVPANFDKLKKNTQKFPKVFHYPCALADFNGNSNFFVSEFTSQPNMPTGSSSLLPPKDHLIFDKGIVFPKKITVPTCTINKWAKDHNIDNIDFMWLDMQGYELPALKSSLDILKNVKVIYIELLFVEAYEKQNIYPEIRSWLESQGFQMIACDFDHQHAMKGKNIKPGEPYFGNGVFINKSFN